MPGGVARVVAVAVLQLLGEDPGLQPVEQLVAVGAQDAHLREVDVPVDEAGQDQAVLQVGDRQAGVAPRQSA